jgi:hypothetical protein
MMTRRWAASRGQSQPAAAARRRRPEGRTRRASAAARGAARPPWRARGLRRLGFWRYESYGMMQVQTASLTASATPLPSILSGPRGACGVSEPSWRLWTWAGREPAPLAGCLARRAARDDSEEGHRVPAPGPPLGREAQLRACVRGEEEPLWRKGMREGSAQGTACAREGTVCASLRVRGEDEPLWRKGMREGTACGLRECPLEGTRRPRQVRPAPGRARPAQKCPLEGARCALQDCPSSLEPPAKPAAGPAQDMPHQPEACCCSTRRCRLLQLWWWQRPGPLQAALDEELLVRSLSAC